MSASRHAVLGPVPASERLEILDALRGVALLGVFAMNIEAFSRPAQEMGAGIPPEATGLDWAVAWGVHVFIAGKFWTMFSLLFGMGFALMSERIAASGRPVAPVFLRRQAVLLAFGLLHIVLMWWGDILHSYAIAGLLLLAMREIAPRWQLAVGLTLYAGVGAFYLANAALLALVPDAMLADFAGALASGREAAERIYPSGSFGEITQRRVSDYLQLGLQSQLFQVPMIAGVFLIGSWLLRGGWLRAPARHRGFWWRLLAWALPPAVLFTALGVWLGTSFDSPLAPRAALSVGLMLLGSLPMSLAYVALLVLAWTSASGQRVLRAFAPAGRMALTHYLAQSLVCSLLFYGYGAGLWGELGRAAQTGLVLVVFALQLAISPVWLARHRHGPVEWLWRWATYGHRPTWRRAYQVA